MKDKNHLQLIFHNIAPIENSDEYIDKKVSILE